MGIAATPFKTPIRHSRFANEHRMNSGFCWGSAPYC